jgi:hypothetical protein
VEDPDALVVASTAPSDVHLDVPPTTNGASGGAAHGDAPSTADASWRAGLEAAAASPEAVPGEGAGPGAGSGTDASAGADTGAVDAPMARSPSQDQPRARSVSGNKVVRVLGEGGSRGMTDVVFGLSCAVLCGWVVTVLHFKSALPSLH